VAAAAVSGAAFGQSIPGLSFERPTGPVFIDAERIEVRPERDATASGDVQLRQGPIVLRADRLSYERADERARADGQVRVTRDGDRFSGSQAELKVDTFEGFVLDPEYFFGVTGAGGRAERIDVRGRQWVQVTRGDYTSCDREGNGTPAWLLSADRVELDFEANEGVAEGAVLRFYGVPILAVPTLRFPATDARKSGWLPPALGYDNRSGFEVGVPYYWNIAPQYDATIAPFVLSRRGAGATAELRYLTESGNGQLNLQGLPDDRLADRSRWSTGLRLQGRVAERWAYRVDAQRVSDDDYWKDFDRPDARFTPRLLPQDAAIVGNFAGAQSQWSVYGGVGHWQVLQTDDPGENILPPYQRSPQVGLRGAGAFGPGLEYTVETEYNRFTLGENDPARLTGDRVHLLGSIALPLRSASGWLTPAVEVNAATYQTDRPMRDGRTSAGRVIPTLSVDGGLVFERATQLFGRDMRQTLVPRVVYAIAPGVDQSTYPDFDSALKDFNEVSIYSPDAFSGIDRVSDANQITAGVSTSFIDDASGIEQLRLALVQRYQVRDPQPVDDGQTVAPNFSDVLLSATSRLSPQWALAASVQYSPSIDRTIRSLLAARYSPGPFRTLAASYRLSRDSTEQAELGWQWPLYGAAPGALGRSACGSGTLYGVGLLNYSLSDQRLTRSVLGFEYDGGCWIGRVVVQQQSTSPTSSNTRVLLQLELSGLSRLGGNPLKVLKDNIPGYQVMGEPGRVPPPPRNYE
jgi:LPS-assembly protein